MTTYAVADLHGRLDLLEGALRALPDSHLLILGDVIDRGPHGLGCVRRLLELQQAGRVTLLWGNHEWMADLAWRSYQQYEASRDLDDLRTAQQHFQWWMHNGGRALQAEAGSFGVERLPPELLEYLTRLQHAAYVNAEGVHREQPPGECVLATHAAPPKAHPEYSDPLTASLWMRPHEGPFPLPAGVSWSVHGHTPLRDPLRLGDQVYTDLGAVATGRLCLTRLDPAGPGDVLVLHGRGEGQLRRLSVPGQPVAFRTLPLA